MGLGKCISVFKYGVIFRTLIFQGPSFWVSMQGGMFEGSVGIFQNSGNYLQFSQVGVFSPNESECTFPSLLTKKWFCGVPSGKRTIDNENKSNSCHIHHTWMCQEVSKWLVNGLSPTYKGLGVETERVPGVETERAMLGPLLRQGVETERANVKNVTGVTGVSGKGWAEPTDVDVARRQGCALCSRGAINLRGPTAEFLDAGTRGSSRTSLLVRSWTKSRRVGFVSGVSAKGHVTKSVWCEKRSKVLRTWLWLWAQLERHNNSHATATCHASNPKTDQWFVVLFSSGSSLGGLVTEESDASFPPFPPVKPICKHHSGHGLFTNHLPTSLDIQVYQYHKFIDSIYCPNEQWPWPFSFAVCRGFYYPGK